jgi:hypothetical protein
MSQPDATPAAATTASAPAKPPGGKAARHVGLAAGCCVRVCLCACVRVCDRDLAGWRFSRWVAALAAIRSEFRAVLPPASRVHCRPFYPLNARRLAAAQKRGDSQQAVRALAGHVQPHQPGGVSRRASACGGPDADHAAARSATTRVRTSWPSRRLPRRRRKVRLCACVRGCLLACLSLRVYRTRRCECADPGDCAARSSMRRRPLGLRNNGPGAFERPLHRGHAAGQGILRPGKRSPLVSAHCAAR